MLQSDILRPLLTKYLPFYKATDSMFLVNFRIRAAAWLVQNGSKDLTMEEARLLSSKKPMASQEFLLTDDPMQKQNLTALLRKVMQEDSSTWDALRFLDQMKSTNPGFDYRIKYDPFGRPEGVCWMLPEMRSDLLRFGNLLFLDSQKRQYNTVGWPYIGPVIKDSEMQVRCVAESICVEESHRMYVWITQMLAEMEPQFHLHSIKVIFGDQALTNQILVDLGITDTCILRGDYHHLINEVWPTTFGTHLYSRLRGDLDRMLLGSRDEWELSYISAKALLLHDASKFSALEEIYNDPSHFAGWFLRNIEGNLFLNGSVPAEQNHSSVAAHLGAGASWSVVEQVSKLLSRQTHLTSKRRQKDTQSYVGSLRYKSRLRDQAAFDDENAKKKLSQYAYDKLYLIAYKFSCRLQFLVQEQQVFVWPNGKPQLCEELVVMKAGERCTCQRRKAFNFQCRHELCHDGKFDLQKYSTRWLNHRTFTASISSHNFQMPLDLPSQPNPMFVVGDVGDIDDGNSFGDENVNLDDDDSNDEETTLSNLVSVSPVTGALSYQFVAEKATNLVRLAQSNPQKLGSLCELFDQLTLRLQHGHSIMAVSFDTAMPTGTLEHNPSSRPVLGTLQAAPNVYNQRRKRSRHENWRSHASQSRSPLLSLLGESNDLAHLPPPRPKTKTCTVCRCPGHQRGSCPKIHKFKQPPFEMGKELQSRHDLSTDLSNRTRYNTYQRPPGDVRVVSISVPTRMIGLVIHQRYFVHGNSTKMCLECTILGSTGDPHETFQKYLFSVEVISSYVTRSKSNVLICELEDDCTQGYESFGYPLSQPETDSQNRQRFLEQQLGLSQSVSLSQQMGYGIPTYSQSDQIGYGLQSFPQTDQMGKVIEASL